MLGLHMVLHIGPLQRIKITMLTVPMSSNFMFIDVCRNELVQTYKLMSWVISKFLCFLKVCICNAFLVGQTVKQLEHWNPLECMCLDSTWFLTEDLFWDEKLQCWQIHTLALSSRHIFSEITRSKPKISFSKSFERKNNYFYYKHSK